MDEAGFAAYRVEAVPAFARDKVLSGQWDTASSLEQARQAFDELLPLGLATPDHHFFTILAAGTRVGMLWYAVRRQPAGDVAYVYDVLVDAQHRQRGHAIAAFGALEDAARDRRLAGIALHVFGHNVAARALYERLGYEATNLNLFKKVEQQREPTDAGPPAAHRTHTLPPPYSLVLATPTIETYRLLRQWSGLGPKTHEAATRGLPRSLFAVQVLCDTEPVGMGRVVGDGGCFYQVTDIAVLPEHQGRGLGEAMLREIVAYLDREVPASGHVSLIADGQAERLHAQFGFVLMAPGSVGMARAVST